MRLHELLAELPEAHGVRGRAGGVAHQSLSIRGLAMDSRRTAPGDLFVALRGELHDGHDHLAEAVELGAVALLVEAIPDDLPVEALAVVVVDDTRKALAPLAAAFYGQPSREINLIGVTGTNGKTSTSYLVESILLAAGRESGLIGTVETRFAAERKPSLNTTPESLELQALLRRMRNHRVDAVVMEVSSHALEIGRTDGCEFEVAAFTNLTQDHLDFHSTMDRYCEAKLHLFRHLLRPQGHAVVHLGDPYATRFVAAARHRGANVYGVARDKRADASLWVNSCDTGLDGTHVMLGSHIGRLDIRSPLLGSFNVDNLLVACGIARALRIPDDAIVRGCAECPQVPGRFERVDTDHPKSPTVIVDYAHTPDAIDKLLAAIRELGTGRVIAVFGCGGDRDHTKRAPMAEAIARGSDLAIATSDNPRNEDPAKILADVERGLGALRPVANEGLGAAQGAYTTCIDRRDAIELAIEIAAPDDTVVIAGKGHEDYQIIGRERLPFDDRVEARRCLETRESA